MAQDRRVMAQDRRMDLGWVDAALAGGGIPSVPGNGRPRVDLGSAVRQALLRARADSWIWRAVYEPLRMRGLWADPRAEKYFFATSMSAMLLERAYGRKGEPVSGVPLRILHRHAVLTCYLDAVVDSGPIEWARGFGMAVFGLAAAPPPFLETHSAEFRRAIEEDMPRLRLAAESPHKAAMMRSLLDAADAESTRACEGFEGAFRYKARSNLACIRPFIPSLGPLLEPLAAVYSFFDDAMDVSEDVASGQPTYMATDEDVSRAAGIARAAIAELNAAAAEDWSPLADCFVALMAAAARKQLAVPPAEYRALERRARTAAACAAVALIAAML